MMSHIRKKLVSYMLMKYAIASNALCINNPDGQRVLEAIFDNARRVDPLKLIENCDLQTLLDEGESYEDFVGSDDCAGCYETILPGLHTYFIQTSGFEFFFTMDGQVPNCVFERNPVFDFVARNPMATLLLPTNHPLCAGKYGYEQSGELLSEELEMIEGNSVRFRLYKDGIAIAGLAVKNNTVDSIYVIDEYRRAGFGTSIFRMVKSVLGTLEHSNSLTDDGKAFVSSFDKRKQNITSETEYV